MRRALLYQLGGADGVDFDPLIEEVSLAEELGVDSVWCFPSAGEEGDFRGSAPEIWLSALASRTKRIRLGWGLAGMLPPGRPPLRVAEQGASLDLASEGRLEVALLPEGALSEGGEATWQEGYRMLVDMWDSPSFSWTSDQFEVRPIDVVPKPVQRPHPPLWLAGWSADHARLAGKGGLGFLDLSGAADEMLEMHRDAYSESRAEADPNDLVCVHNYAVGGDLEPGEISLARLARWEELGFDEAVIRVGPLEGGHLEAVERIRFLTTAATKIH
jgi:alkanesulfonate monooxygenase SsuD/methylene tetrahydromethanopterin reductase-like flavin-dependent oxidoreductase (luciferase family)